MKKLKVMTVVGTRPELIRLSRVIATLDTHVDHILVHTGQNYDYELNDIFFNELGIKYPKHLLSCAAKSATETIGNIISKIDGVLTTERPDAFLVLGDTNSGLSAISAKKHKVPIFHMEAGNRCFDQRVPEETNRKIIDHISDINLTYSDLARENLLREGLSPERSIKTGSPMYEVLKYFEPAIEKSNILENMDLKFGNYFVVSCHREENVDSDLNLNRLKILLESLHNKTGIRIIVSTHPRTRKRFEERGITFGSGIELLKPLGFLDYIKLQQHSKAVLSDSGTISEESSILNFPAVNLREAHERPEAMEEAAVMMTGLNVDRIFQALSILENQKRGSLRSLRQVYDYSMPNVSDKVLRLILSYTDYVKRVVWGQSPN